ncbi:MAG: hypothetical protein ACREVF_06370 [Burkholderiales bacterium]
MTILEGTWYYQSFLILPTPSEEEAPPGSVVTARKWAMGTLTVPADTSPEVSGELAFATGATLAVKGQVLPASDSSPAILVATGEGLAGSTEGSIYQIVGAFFSDASGQQFIYGSTLGVRGPDTQPDVAGGMPINTVGTFILSRRIADK